MLRLVALVLPSPDHSSLILLGLCHPQFDRATIDAVGVLLYLLRLARETRRRYIRICTPDPSKGFSCHSYFYTLSFFLLSTTGVFTLFLFGRLKFQRR